MSTPTPRDVEALIELFDSSDWKELDLRTEGFELFLSKDPASRRVQRNESPSAFSSARGIAPERSMASGAGSPTSVIAQAPVPSSWVAVRAPNLGTFYRSPKPGAPPYVEIGQHVSADAEVCLIEVMKLFTSVRAGVNGVVRKLVVQDAEMVEHDQVLLYIEPQG